MEQGNGPLVYVIRIQTFKKCIHKFKFKFKDSRFAQL